MRRFVALSNKANCMASMNLDRILYKFYKVSSCKSSLSNLLAGFSQNTFELAIKNS
jgi:hypothetical protein